MTNLVNQSCDLVFCFRVDADGLCSLAAKPVDYQLSVNTALTELRLVTAREVSVPNRLKCGNEKLALGAFAQFRRRRHSGSGLWPKRNEAVSWPASCFLCIPQISLPQVRPR